MVVVSLTESTYMYMYIHVNEVSLTESTYMYMYIHVNERSRTNKGRKKQARPYKQQSKETQYTQGSQSPL